MSECFFLRGNEVYASTAGIAPLWRVSGDSRALLRFDSESLTHKPSVVDLVEETISRNDAAYRTEDR